MRLMERCGAGSRYLASWQACQLVIYCKRIATKPPYHIADCPFVILLVWINVAGSGLLFTVMVAVQWTTVGDVDIDIGANPSAEEAEEGVESTDRKTVDIIESFRLNVSYIVSQPPIAIFCGAVTRSMLCLLSLRPLSSAKQEQGMPFCDGGELTDHDDTCAACRSNPPMTRSSSWAGLRYACYCPHRKCMPAPVRGDLQLHHPLAALMLICCCAGVVTESVEEAE